MQTLNKINQAKAQGYSDEEITSYLSKNDNSFKSALEKGYKPEEVYSFLSKKLEPRSRLKDVQYGLEQGAQDTANQIFAGQQAQREELPNTGNTILQERLRQAGISEEEQAQANQQARENFVSNAGFNTTPPEDLIGKLLSGGARGAVGAATQPAAPGTGLLSTLAGVGASGAFGSADVGLEEAGVDNPLVRMALLFSSLKAPSIAKKLSPSNIRNTFDNAKTTLVEKRFGIKPEQVNKTAFNELEEFGVKTKPLSSFVDNNKLAAYETDLISDSRFRGRYEKSFEELTDSLKGEFDKALKNIESQGLSEKRLGFIENPQAATDLLRNESTKLNAWENKAWDKAMSHVSPNDFVTGQSAKSVKSSIQNRINSIQRGGVTSSEIPTLKYYESLQDQISRGSPANQARIDQLEQSIRRAQQNRFQESFLSSMKKELETLRNQIPVDQLIEAKKKLNSMVKWDEVAKTSDLTSQGLLRDVDTALEQFGTQKPGFINDYRTANKVTSDLKRSIHQDVVETALKNNTPERLSALLSTEKGIRIFNDAMNYSPTTRELGNKFKSAKIQDIFGHKLFKGDDLRKGYANFLDIEPGQKRLLKSLAGNEAWNRFEKMSRVSNSIAKPLNKFVNSSGTAAAAKRQGLGEKALAFFTYTMSGNLLAAAGVLTPSVAKYTLAKLLTDPKLQQSILKARTTPSPTNLSHAQMQIFNLLKQSEEPESSD